MTLMTLIYPLIFHFSAINFHRFLIIYELEFRESDVSQGKMEVKQGKFVKFIFLAKGFFRETYKSQNINPISPTPTFTLGIYNKEEGKGQESIQSNTTFDPRHHMGK